MNVYVKILLIVGGLNWGLVGIGGFMDKNWDVVGNLLTFGESSVVANIVFVVVGLAAVVALFSFGKKGDSGMGGGNPAGGQM